jgi:Na+/melibiose symporter-like transporter
MQLQDSFYIPFWFQSVQGHEALAAGVRMIAFAVPQIVALIVAGAVVTKTGYYVRFHCRHSSSEIQATDICKVPLIIVGGLVSVAGTALLTKLQPHSPTLNWAAYMVVTSVGQGTAMQLPYTAVGVVLR